MGAVLARANGAQAQAISEAEGEHQARERAVLLAQVLPEALRVRSVWIGPPLVIAAGVGMGGLGVAGRAPGLVVGGAIGVLGGAGFYLMPEGRNYELLIAASQASLGFYYAGLPLGEPHQRWQIPIGVGYLGMSALSFVNFAYSTHPGRTRLRFDLDAVRTPEARARLTPADVRRLERDLLDTEPFLPRWLLGLPLVAGGVLALAPAFDDDLRDGDRALAGVLAGLALVQGMTFSFAGETPGERYRSSLERGDLRLALVPLPGGVSVVGSFE